MRTISFIINQAKNKLTRLGMSLFYFYLLLTLLGFAGVVFGVSTIILNIIHINSIVNALSLEAIILIVISCFMVKIFLRESLILAGADNLSQLRKPEDASEQEQQIAINKVIPFQRKHNRN